VVPRAGLDAEGRGNEADVSSLMKIVQFVESYYRRVCVHTQTCSQKYDILSLYFLLN
jgi:hypothetical protein